MGRFKKSAASLRGRRSLSQEVEGCEFGALLDPMARLMAEVANVILGWNRIFKSLARLAVPRGQRRRVLGLEFAALFDPVSRDSTKTTNIIPRGRHLDLTRIGYLREAREGD